MWIRNSPADAQPSHRNQDPPARCLAALFAPRPHEPNLSVCAAERAKDTVMPSTGITDVAGRFIATDAEEIADRLGHGNVAALKPRPCSVPIAKIHGGERDLCGLTTSGDRTSH